MMGKKLLWISAVLLFSNSFTYADSTLYEITVTPEKKPTRLIDTLNSVEIITSDDIKTSGFITMEEVLNSSSSISIGSNGGFGQTKSIFMRGTESNHTKVLVNGMELNPGTLGVPSLQHIPPEIVERVEISKSGMSSLYGKDSIGGVINIITKNDGADSISLMSGRYDTNRLSLYKSMQTENQKVSINLSRMLSDSFKAKTSSNQNHAYENKVFDMKYKFFSGSYNYSLDYYRNHGSTEYDSFGSNLSQIHKDNHFKAMMTKELGDNQISFSYVRKGNEINQSAASATDYTHTKTDSLIFENIIGKNMIIGFSYSDESMYELSYGTSFDTTNLIRELYLNTNYQYYNFNFNIGARNTNHSVYGDFLTGNFNLGKKITDGMLIFGLISKTFRAPDATDLYGYSGNPNLEPEESISHEIGIKTITSFGDFSVSYFNNDIDNLIESDGSQMQNINKAEIRGVELDFSTRLNDGIDYNVKYTYQEPDDLTNDTLLSRRPRNKFVSVLSKTFSDNDMLKLTVTGQSRRDNSIYDGHRLGGYALFDINYLTNIADYQVGIKMNNIFDKKYRLAHNYNTEGQSIYITFRGNF